MLRNGETALPARTVTNYHVTFWHGDRRWTAEIVATAISAEGDTVDVGSQRVEFGPFDDHTSVAQWLCKQAHAYSKRQTAEVITPPDDPPQGRRLPDSE